MAAICLAPADRTIAPLRCVSTPVTPSRSTHSSLLIVSPLVVYNLSQNPSLYGLGQLAIVGVANDRS